MKVSNTCWSHLTANAMALSWPGFQGHGIQPSQESGHEETSEEWQNHDCAQLDRKGCPQSSTVPGPFDPGSPSRESLGGSKPSSLLLQPIVMPRLARSSRVTWTASQGLTIWSVYYLEILTTSIILFRADQINSLPPDARGLQ